MSLEGSMAEREGFEPPVAFRLRLISSQVHSTGLCHLSACKSPSAIEWQPQPTLPLRVFGAPHRHKAEEPHRIAGFSPLECGRQRRRWTFVAGEFSPYGKPNRGPLKFTGKALDVAMPAPVPAMS